METAAPSPLSDGDPAEWLLVAALPVRRHFPSLLADGGLIGTDDVLKITPVRPAGVIINVVILDVLDQQLCCPHCRTWSWSLFAWGPSPRVFSFVVIIFSCIALIGRPPTRRKTGRVNDYVTI